MPTHPPITILALLLLAASLPATAPPVAAALPDMGGPAGQAVSPEDERRIGKALMQELRRKGLVLDDPLVASYLASLGGRLVTASGNAAGSFHFFFVRDRRINAFAAPGGYIGVHTGLMLAAARESELAGVLAHEIAHVTQRHLARAFEATRRLSLPMAAATLAAILLGSVDAQAGQAAMTAAMAGLTQKRINFTRAHEEEADRIGLQILHKAGYPGHGMVSFFERLARQSRLLGEPVELLSTHPVTSRRMAEARARLRPGQAPDSLAFHLAKARIDILTATAPQDPLIRYRTALARGDGTGTPEAALRYGLALALTATGQAREAVGILQALLSSDPDRIAYRIALADAFLAASMHLRALEVLDEGLTLHPSNPLLLRAKARALLEAGDAVSAYRHLAPLIRPGVEDPSLLRLYGRIAQAAGRPAEAHRAQAEAYVVEGRLEAAIDQLELALRHAADDDYMQERLTARLRELLAHQRMHDAAAR